MHPGGETRQRLLQAAIAVFAEHGYHRASTREICRRAGANNASIHYHFGDKANLYREVFRFALSAAADAVAAPLDELPRREALVRFYRGLLAPLAGAALPQQLLRLRLREELEPSGVLGDTVAEALRPRHARLTALIVRDLRLRAADAEVERLAFALVGMGVVFHHLNDVVVALAPRLSAGAGWLDATAERLADYATTVLDGEAARRAALKASA
jgi:AcrR family transcriptional regulator